MTNRTIVVITAALFALLPSPCFGWGDEGHQIVGEIAWQELKPEVRAAVRPILETDPNVG